MSNDMGGPAFPMPMVQNPTNGEMDWGDPGMSKWDYFAAAALSGLVASDGKIKPYTNTGNAYAYFAAEIADAMLQERRKRMNAKYEPARESSIEKDGSG